MATEARQRPRRKKPATHEFTLVLSGPSEISDAIADALYEAGCDDALLAVCGGESLLAFDREHESLEAAVRSAIQDVERSGLGIDVQRVILPGAEAVERINDVLSLRRKVLVRLPEKQAAAKRQEFSALLDDVVGQPASTGKSPRRGRTNRRGRNT